MPITYRYWQDYDHVDQEFEAWWASRAMAGPLIDPQYDQRYIDRIKALAREFFHDGYEQRRKEIEGDA